MKFDKAKLFGVLKTTTTLSVTLALTAVCSFAASPVGNMMNKIMDEATGTWAVGGSVTAGVLGGLGSAFGSHGIQEKATKLLIGSCVALGSQAVIYAFVR